MPPSTHAESRFSSKTFLLLQLFAPDNFLTAAFTRRPERQNSSAVPMEMEKVATEEGKDETRGSRARKALRRGVTSLD